jgi:hypothetical protein
LPKCEGRTPCFQIGKPSYGGLLNLSRRCSRASVAVDETLEDWSSEEIPHDDLFSHEWAKQASDF